MSSYVRVTRSWVAALVGLGIMLGAIDANGLDIVDQRGRNLHFNTFPERLVVIPIPAPSTFMAIDGSEKKIVGMNEYAARAMQDGIFGKLFPGFKNIPTNVTMGGDASSFAPNIEAILALRPDAVFQWASGGDVITALERTGMPVIGMRVGTFENYTDYVRLMGSVAGKDDRAMDFLRKQDAVRQSLSARFAGLRPSDRPRVLYFNRARGLMRVSGQNTAQDLMIRLAGGENAMGDIRSISSVGIEQVLTWNPQVILLGNFDSTMPSDLYGDPRWQGVDAVKNRRVYRVPLGGYRWDPPSHESSLGWVWLAGLLHPEQMPGDLRKEIRDWFGFLYGYNPSDDEIDGMLYVEKNASSLGYEIYRAR